MFALKINIKATQVTTALELKMYVIVSFPENLELLEIFNFILKYTTEKFYLNT